MRKGQRWHFTGFSEPESADYIRGCPAPPGCTTGVLCGWKKPPDLSGPFLEPEKGLRREMLLTLGAVSDAATHSAGAGPRGGPGLGLGGRDPAEMTLRWELPEHLGGPAPWEEGGWWAWPVGEGGR